MKMAAHVIVTLPYSQNSLPFSIILIDDRSGRGIFPFEKQHVVVLYTSLYTGIAHYMNNP